MVVGMGLERQRMAMDFKGSHFERDIVLWGVRWYVAYPISYRQLEREFVAHKRPVSNSWRLDETSVRIKGKWKYQSGSALPP
jgi:putative transposase